LIGKKVIINLKVGVIVILFLGVFLTDSSAQTNGLLTQQDFTSEKSGKNLFERFFGQFEGKREQHAVASEEPIFWDLNDGANITYNPVTLFVNYFYWDALPFYSDEEEYLFEMYANETTIFNSSYQYAKYNQYYWNLGFDWNISHYTPNTFVNITVFFYQESDSSKNHTAFIGVTIRELKETPEIVLDDFTIHLFHWPGDAFSGGGYYYYNPDGVNPYYHFAIYSSGHIEFKFADREIYENNDLSRADIQALLQELISLKFFQLKNYYRAPGYDYLYDSFYQIAIKSQEVDEWRQAEEAKTFVVKPNQYAKCLAAIKNVVDNLYFAPLRWKWDLFFIIGGSILGGGGALFGLIYFIALIRRRR